MGVAGEGGVGAPPGAYEAALPLLGEGAEGADWGTWVLSILAVIGCGGFGGSCDDV